MMFDANYRGREAIKTLLGSAFADNLRAIETERSITLPDLRRTYTYPTDATSRAGTVVFPCAEVMPPSGDIDATSGSSVYSALSFWVHVNVSTAKPEQADVLCEGYLTALVRTFGLAEYGDMTLTVTRLDTSLPAPTESGSVQTVAVLVQVTAAE